jgi:uncharacterized protein (UPF0332 family)
LHCEYLETYASVVVARRSRQERTEPHDCAAGTLAIAIPSPEIHIEKAARALASAHACADAGHHEAAVSRAHFAAHHAVSALLSTLGLAARTSAELREGIGRHFIRTGRLPPRFARLLVRIAADRDDADCNAASTFNAADAREAIEAAAEVLEGAERALQRIGATTSR